MIRGVCRVHASMHELFDIVDETDRVIGTATRDEVHGNPVLTHRVVHVLVFDGPGRLYLQKRALNKDVQPGKWDTSVGGHVDAGEDLLHAAIREMREELGIAGPTPEFIYRYLHRNDFESEMVATYLVHWDGDVQTDPEEISEGRFWTLAEISSADHSIFTPNFLDELARYQDWTHSRAP